MALLFETSLGDLTIDLDISGSPQICKNVLKLAKARYYTSTLFHTIKPNEYCALGDARGDGSGGCSIYSMIDSLSKYHDMKHVYQSEKRFIKSTGRILTKEELQEKGRVAVTDLIGFRDTIGSQFMITLGPTFVDRWDNEEDEKRYISLGIVSEDNDGVLDRINNAYCDGDGRAYADIRIIRAHILHDPFDDPEGMDQLLKYQSVKLLDPVDLPAEHVECSRWLASSSPILIRPKEEIVEIRISAQDAEKDVDYEIERKRAKDMAQKDDRSRAVMLEMLGDLPSADMKPPENVLFVCKLNPVTEDEDLQLIFSRFDPNCKAEIIRDSDTGDSLQYAFIEFNTEEACNQAYFKMNNALVDDRRIKVDFSQSVSKEWHKFQKKKQGLKVNYSSTDRYGNVSRPSSQNNRNLHNVINSHRDMRRTDRSRSDSVSSGKKSETRTHRKRTDQNHDRHRDRRKYRSSSSSSDGYRHMDSRRYRKDRYYRDRSYDKGHKSRKEKKKSKKHSRYREDTERKYREKRHRSRSRSDSDCRKRL
jgi:peptidyl-prolyl cis-trans isomerase-like 4